MPPRAKRSKLDPFKAQIFELRALGYANGQIRDWLATVGIKVTQEAVRKFVVTREPPNTQPVNKDKSAVVPKSAQATSQGLVASPPLADGHGETYEPGLE